MKRCPQCLFLYPDSDERCDFDKTPLEAVDDAAVDAATSATKPRPRQQRTLMIAAGAALMLFVLSLATYFGLSKQTQEAEAAPPAASRATPLPSTSAPQEPSPSPTVSPSPSPSPSPQASKEIVATSHSRATVDPVSTSGPGIASRQGGKPLILLSSGGKIEADEVWRTKDGVWYRRNGMVTLLKRGEVKAIVTR